MTDIIIISMTFHNRNERGKPFSKSQVITKNQNNSSHLSRPLKNNFVQSLVPDLTKKYNLLQKKQTIFQTNYQPNQIHDKLKGYEHLLSPKSKKVPISPLMTYRSAQNLSPRTFRQNYSGKNNQAELQENRSAKFIRNLRQKIEQNETSNMFSRTTKKNEKASLNYKILMDNKMQKILDKKRKNQEYHYLHRDQDFNRKNKKQSQSKNQESQDCYHQSSQRLNFQAKLIFKCRALQEQLEVNLKQAAKLKLTYQSQQKKHLSQLNHLKTQRFIQTQIKQTQIKTLKEKLSAQQLLIKKLEKSNQAREKAIQQQIQKYINQIKELTLDRGRFQQILKQKSLHLQKLCKQIQQQKQQILEQIKFVSEELTNYTKWNQQLERKSIYLQRQLNQSENLTKKLKDQIELLQSQGIKLKRQLKEQQQNNIYEKGNLIKEFQILSEENLKLKEKNKQNQQIIKHYQKELHKYSQRIGSLSKNVENLQSQDQLITHLQNKIQKLQIQIEEWKFICESNALNKSLSFEINQIYHPSKQKSLHPQQKSSTLQPQNVCQYFPNINKTQPDIHILSQKTQNNRKQSKNINLSKTQINLLDSIQSSLSFGETKNDYLI